MVESYSSTAHPTPARNTSWKPQRLQEPLAEGGWKRRNERQAFLGCWGGLGPNLSVLSSFPQGRDQGVRQVQVLRHRSGCRRPKLVGQLRNLRASGEGKVAKSRELSRRSPQACGRNFQGSPNSPRTKETHLCSLPDSCFISSTLCSEFKSF